MKKIVLFASGNGSNAENIMVYFDLAKTVSVVGVFTNNSEAKVIERAKNLKSRLLFLIKWNFQMIPF